MARPEILTEPEVVYPDPDDRPGQIVTFRWVAYEGFLRTAPTKLASIMRHPSYECCHCHQRMNHADTWTVIPADLADRQAGPGYLHCSACRTAHRPGDAWWSARREDLARRGGVPAPARDDVPYGTT